jgi:hypothetical protein
VEAVVVLEDLHHHQPMEVAVELEDQEHQALLVLQDLQVQLQLVELAAEAPFQVVPEVE